MGRLSIALRVPDIPLGKCRVAVTLTHSETRTLKEQMAGIVRSRSRRRLLLLSPEIFTRPNALSNNAGAAERLGTGLLCMDCFKAETDESCLGYGATRHTIRCSGCNEYINTIRNPRYRRWRCCSNRCYQRDYRKRRRGLRSVVEWKCRQPKCKACHKPFQPSRTDAVYCSSGCRQWTYRRRIWANQRRNSPPRKRRRVHDLKRQ